MRKSLRRDPPANVFIIGSLRSNIWAEAMRRFKALAVLLLLGGCRSEAPRPQPQPVVVWKPLGTWSGRGDKQTETFTGDTGGFRVHWETANEAPAGSGRLRVVFRSGDSGREIIEAIDARGAGSGTEEVAAERPRWYYITVESANVDWKIAVDERIEAQTTSALRD